MIDKIGMENKKQKNNKKKQTNTLPYTAVNSRSCDKSAGKSSDARLG